MVFWNSLIKIIITGKVLLVSKLRLRYIFVMNISAHSWEISSEINQFIHSIMIKTGKIDIHVLYDYVILTLIPHCILVNSRKHDFSYE
jgi:hypothetical protein